MIELRDGPAALTIDPDHGGRLASLTVAGRELLVPHSAGVSAIGWGSFLMAPWPGRLRDAELDWEGRTLPAPSGRSAVTRSTAWSTTGAWTVERASAGEPS